jgi:hypothetical protein
MLVWKRLVNNLKLRKTNKPRLTKHKLEDWKIGKHISATDFLAVGKACIEP